MAFELKKITGTFDVAPPGAVNRFEYSPDGSYLAVAHDITPFVTIYKVSGNTHTKLPNPESLPFANGRSASWSPDGIHLVIGVFTNEPGERLVIYKRLGDTFTRITGYLEPEERSVGVSFSPDGKFMFSHNMYEVSGDTFTRTSFKAPASSIARAPAWSPDGEYFAFGIGSVPFVQVYRRSGVNGSTFTKLPDLSTSDDPSSGLNDITFNGNGNHMVTCGALAFQDLGHQVRMYKLDGDSISLLHTFRIASFGASMGGTYYLNDSYFLATVVNTPGIAIFSVDGDTYTRILPLPVDEMPDSLNNRYTATSPDGSKLLMGTSTTDRFTLYSLESDYHLIKTNDDTILTWDGLAWIDTLLTPSDLMTTDIDYTTNFETHGFSDLSLITDTEIQLLTGLGYTSFKVLKTTL